MLFKEYDEASKQFAIYPRDTPMAGVLYATLGLTGEAGEVAEKVKKALRGDHTLESKREEIKMELGDVLWYVFALARDLDLDVEEIAKANIEKLTSRQKRDVIKGSGDNR